MRAVRKSEPLNSSHPLFTADASELESAAHFRAESGVALTIDRADSNAWHATATHRRLAEVCTFGGPGSRERQPTCR